MQSAFVVHLPQLPAAALHLLPFALVEQSRFVAHLAQSPVTGWQVGRLVSKLQSLLAVHLAQSPVAWHLGAVVSLASHSALVVQATQVLPVQMGRVAVAHCAELLHCTHWPVPVLQRGPNALPVQSASTAQARQACVAASQLGVAAVVQLAALRHCTQPVPARHWFLPAMSAQSAATLQPTQLFVPLQTEAAALVQSELPRHCTQPVPTLHWFLPEMSEQSLATAQPTHECPALHFDAAAVVQSLFILHWKQELEKQ